MRECDTHHHTRSVKTSSAVNLSRKPRLDLCCDLLQHLQGVTVDFFSSLLVFTWSYFEVYTYVGFARSITQFSCLSYIWKMYPDQIPRSNSRIIWMAVFAHFLFDSVNKHHITNCNGIATAVGRQMSGFEPSFRCFCVFSPRLFDVLFWVGDWVKGFLSKCGTVHSSNRTPDEWVRALSFPSFCAFLSLCFPFFIFG